MSDKYVILPDVTCELCQEIRDYFGIKDYIKGFVHFSDGRDFNTTLDWSNISREEFYKALSNKKMQISTAPMSPEGVYQAMKGYAEQGYNVICPCISSKISSSYNVFSGAAERVMAEFPEIKIYCVDSYRMSGALGVLVMHAFDLQRNGKTFEEVIDWFEDNKLRVHQMGPIDDLIFVARRGRISMGKAIMGSFAGVKPMGDCNSDGYVTVLTKAKGINKALDLTAKYLKEMAVDIENQYVLIAHSNREAYANKLKELIEGSVTPKKIFITDVFSGCGTNIGPGMVGVYFLGNKTSDDLSVEKECMNKILESK